MNNYVNSSITTSSPYINSNSDNLLFSDNPNYFNTMEGDGERTPKTPDSPSRNFFSFKKWNQNSKAKIVQNHNNNNIELPSMGKRRGSLRNLLRSRSNSTSSQPSPTPKMNKASTLDYRNTAETSRFRERLGSYNEASVSYAGNDDVFYSPPSNDSRLNYNTNQSQYSNSMNESVTSPGGPRRHSISNFMQKERLRAVSITDEVPKMPPPSVPRTRDTRKNGDHLSTMDDILIVTARQSEPGILWVNYLKACFDKITKQRGRQPFNFLHLKIDDDQITPQLIQRCMSTKLQIVVICSQLLSLPPNFLLGNLSQILKPERVLGMLLEVSEERVWEIHKSAFPSFKQWRRCFVRSTDQSFISDLLGIATDILGRALRQQPVCTEVTTPTKATAGNNDSFTLFPRKVKVGQNKVLIILAEPLVKDDWIKIKIERTGQITEITNIKRRNPYTIQFTIPEYCMEVSMMVGIRVEKNCVDIGCRPLKCESRLRELEQILKAQDAPMDFMCHSMGITSSDRDKLDLYLVQSFQKNIPPNFHLLNSAEVQNGMKLNREANPEEYPSLLHFAAKWGLERLCLQLLDCPGSGVACEMRNICGRTPAELAEASGHEKLASSCRDFSKVNEFATMYHYFKGYSESSPNKAVIEAKPSTTKPIEIEPPKVEAIPERPRKRYENEGYMEMNGSGTEANETANSVSNLNYLSIDSSSKDEVDGPVKESEQEIRNNLDSVEPEVMFNELRITEPSYFESNEFNRTDEFSLECSNLLESCHESESDYLFQPSNIPVQPDNQDFGDYLTHPSNIPVELDGGDDKQHYYNNLEFGGSNYQNMPSNKKVNQDQSDLESSHLRMSFKKKDEDSKSKTGTLKRQGSTTSKKSVDDEFIEILNDFKNSVFTIEEVEQLVASWKNRNDVQKSFKDKQEQLQKMRQEYERIQQQMKEKLKRPTPFERMKRLFTRSKSSSSKEVKNLPELSDVCEEIKFTMLQNASNRPMSTLSLHSVSSGSSGRMSTGSACSGASLGDSGTHSDHEERRQAFGCRVGNPGSLMENYMVPPAPRPVITPASTPTPVEEKDRLHYPSFHHSFNEHYIMFPSNIPVHSPANDYMNMPSSGLKTIDETKETESGNLSHPPPSVPIKIQKKEIIYSQLERQAPQMSSFKRSQSFEKPVSDDIQSNINQLTKSIKECNESINELKI